MKQLVKVTLQNPLDNTDTLDYYIKPNDTQLARDWIVALKEILSSKLSLQKQYCFLGWPDSNRTIEYLCDELNKAIKTINLFDFTEHGLDDYVIEEWFTPEGQELRHKKGRVLEQGRQGTQGLRQGYRHRFTHIQGIRCLYGRGLARSQRGSTVTRY